MVSGSYVEICKGLIVCKKRWKVLLQRVISNSNEEGHKFISYFSYCQVLPSKNKVYITMNETNIEWGILFFFFQKIKNKMK